uniref:Uncharacterized protein n=1 Tax=Octopus bimaculoides TaxID=37653 RepID=A0A0L8IG10_OCTBM
MHVECIIYKFLYSLTHKHYAGEAPILHFSSIACENLFILYFKFVIMPGSKAYLQKEEVQEMCIYMKFVISYSFLVWAFAAEI